MTPFQQRLARERNKATIEAGVINVALALYFLLGLYYLGLLIADVRMGEFAYNGLAVGLLVPLGIVLGGLWTRSADSPGRAFIERTNDFLKSQRVESPGPWYGKLSTWALLAILALTVVLGWALTDISFYQLFSPEGLAGAQRIFVAVFTPNLKILGIVLEKMVETIFIALMATAIAVPIAFIGSFFAARNLMRGSAATMALYNLLRLVFNVTRSVEPLIWAIIFSVWVGIGAFAGMMALMLHSVASLIKLYSEQIENIDEGPVEAITATGANWVQVIWYAVVPQIVLPYLSFTIYRWDINIRMATIIGLVGGGGIGTLLMQYQGLAKWNEVGTIVIVIAIVVWLMDYISARVREAIY